VTTRSDTEIWEDIRDELWWSPFVDDDEVDVRVDEGTATLTGTVDSMAECQAATENAYEGGAVHVVNKLQIADDAQ
jgi:osmotically-inducible protein OsmY